MSGIAGARIVVEGAGVVGGGSAASQARTIGLMRDGQITFGVLPSHPMNWSLMKPPLPSGRIVAGS